MSIKLLAGKVEQNQRKSKSFADKQRRHSMSFDQMGLHSLIEGQIIEVHGKNIFFAPSTYALYLLSI